MLGFLVKLTESPEHIGPHDVASLRALGVTERAIIDATYICMGFNVINRIADATGFELPPVGVFARAAWYMRAFGYRMMSGSWTRNNGGGVRSNEIDPYDAMMRRLQDAVFSGPGTLDAAIRQAISGGAQISGALGISSARLPSAITKALMTALQSCGWKATRTTKSLRLQLAPR